MDGLQHFREQSGHGTPDHDLPHVIIMAPFIAGIGDNGSSNVADPDARRRQTQLSPVTSTLDDSGRTLRPWPPYPAAPAARRPKTFDLRPRLPARDARRLTPRPAAHWRLDDWGDAAGGRLEARPTDIPGLELNARRRGCSTTPADRYLRPGGLDELGTSTTAPRGTRRRPRRLASPRLRSATGVRT